MYQLNKNLSAFKKSKFRLMPLFIFKIINNSKKMKKCTLNKRKQYFMCKHV